jgi:hypothetical protein
MAAIYDARRRQGSSSDQVLDNIVSGSNCESPRFLLSISTKYFHFTNPSPVAVDRDEVDRLRKRFMKLDKVSETYPARRHGSGANGGRRE